MRWLLVPSLTGLAACSSGDGQPRAERALPEPITVSSPAFTAGSPIPVRFPCDGDNAAPPWPGRACRAGRSRSPWSSMIQTRPGAPMCTGSSSPSTRASTKLAEATVPPGVRQLRNSAGKAADTGPCPPGGPAHHYRFTIYALQRTPDVADASPQAAIQAIEAAATARGRLTATFGR